MRPVGKSRNDVLKTQVAGERFEARAVAPNGHDAANGDSLEKGHDIAVLAYELFLQRGGQHGHDLEDWLAAERRLANREG